MRPVAVIPAKNEEKKLPYTLTTLKKLNLSKIIVIVNGCNDRTLEAALAQGPPVEVIYFPEALGYDVPRAIGAAYALDLGALGVLFIDADMTGPLEGILEDILQGITENTDMALVNCYPHITFRDSFVSFTLFFRELLNRKLGLFHKIGLASPSHGPHAISNNFLKNIPLAALAKPPVSMALASLQNLIIKVHAAFPHISLGSTIRNFDHAEKISHTIIGDCLEALNIVKGTKISRSYLNMTYDGYDSLRRFDILDDVFKRKRELVIFRG
ncbi:MAG: hypothetical protein JG764_1459 [Clostridiales bacterium]|jgi:glycosyltransferase involved in cell wall biosynthesis|nr:hypothetical protein [Clostridiales bacterium]